MMTNTKSYDCLYIEVASVRHPKIGNADLGMVALISAFAAIGASGLCENFSTTSPSSRDHVTVTSSHKRTEKVRIF